MKRQSTPLINIGKPRVLTIDLDISNLHREKVIEYTKEKYGYENDGWQEIVLKEDEDENEIEFEMLFYMVLTN